MHCTVCNKSFSWIKGVKPEIATAVAEKNDVTLPGPSSGALRTTKPWRKTKRVATPNEVYFSGYNGLSLGLPLTGIVDQRLQNPQSTFYANGPQDLTSTAISSDIFLQNYNSLRKSSTGNQLQQQNFCFSIFSLYRIQQYPSRSFYKQLFSISKYSIFVHILSPFLSSSLLSKSVSFSYINFDFYFSRSHSNRTCTRTLNFLLIFWCL